MSVIEHFRSFLKGNFSILITGQRKSGKSALMYRLGEIAHELRPDRGVYVVNLPDTEKARSLLPEWIRPLEKNNIDKVENAILLFEESSLIALSRNWYTRFNKLLSQLNAIAYHKRQSHIYVIQNMRLLDPNVISLIDVVMVKQYSYVQYKLEREMLRDIVSTSVMMLRRIPLSERKKYAVVVGFYDYPPFLFKYDLPSFWKEDLAYLWESFQFTDIEEIMHKTALETAIELIKQGKVKTWKDLRKYFPEKSDGSLQVLLSRARKRIKEESLIP